LAAPRIVRLPAIVLPAARAMNWAVSPPARRIMGRKRATNGTLEMNWLVTTLVQRIAGIEENAGPPMNAWNNPVCQTLSMSTNMAAKKTRVGQSILLISTIRDCARRRIGAAAQTAITGSDMSIFAPATDAMTFAPARMRRMATEHFARGIRSFLPVFGIWT